MTVTVQEAIYRAKVEGQQSVDNMARAVDGLAVSEEKLTRATRASEQGFERLVGKIDPAARAQQKYQQVIEQVQRYEAAGIGSAQQRANVVSLATARYEQQIRALGGAAVANDNFAKKTGLASHEIKNLGFQLNDIATMLAMGQSPFRVLASQGGQVYQVLAGSERGLIGSIKGLGSAISAFLGPLGMAAAGLTAAGAAAYYFWSASKEPAKTTEELLEEQVRLIGLIKKGYEDGAKAADKFAASVSSLVRLQEEQNRIEMQRRLAQETQGFIGKVTSTTPSTMAGFIDEPLSGNSQVVERYRAFTAQIEALQAGLARGAPDVRQFREEVAAMGLAAPKLQPLVNELLSMSDAIEKLDPFKLQQTRDELERIGQVNATKGFTASYKSLLEAAPEVNKEALRQQKLLDLARKRGEAIDAINKSEDLYANRSKHLAEVESAYQRGVAEILKDQVNSYTQLIQKTKDRVEELELEAQTYGKTSAEVVKLKLQHDAERAAKQANVRLNQEELNQLKEKLALATREAQVAQIRRDIAYSSQGATMGLSDSELQIARQLKAIYPDITEALNSNEAAQLRAIENMRELKSATDSFAQSLVSGLMAGGDAMQAITSAASGLVRQLASASMKRFLDTGSFTPQGSKGYWTGAGPGSGTFVPGTPGGPGLMSAQGGLGMAAVGYSAYQGGVQSASPLQGALAGALSGALAGAMIGWPAGAVVGGVVGGAAGLFGGLSGQSAAQKQAEAQAHAERLAMIDARNQAKKTLVRQYDLRGSLAGIDTQTQAGALEAFDLRAASELRQIRSTPGMGHHELVVAEAALAKERLQIMEDFAKRAVQQQRSYEDRILAATTDASTQEGALALFDRAAQREREAAIESGSTQIALLEEALAAERLQIIERFAEQANSIESRRLAFADRLFAATTDTTTLQGQLAAFDRAAQREREEEIAAGGEAILELEAALNAERLNIIADYNARILQETKAAKEAERQAAIQTTTQILEYVQGLQTGAESPLSPGDRLTAAQSSYTSNLTLAAGGDADAYGRFTQEAEAYRLAAQAMFGSAAGYQTVFNQIIADALNLSAPAASIDPVVNALQDVVAAIGVANGSIISTGANTFGAINANTGEVTTQGVATKLAVDSAKSAIDQTRTQVASSGVATTNAVNTNNTLVTTGNTLATTNNTLATTGNTIASSQDVTLDAIENLGAIQRQIGNGLGNLMSAIGSNTIVWLEAIRYYTLRTAQNTGGIPSGGGVNAPPTGGWSWAGFERGGVVSNGIHGRDSVLAMLAGGEGVLTAGATAAIGGRAAIDYINRTGMVPANDNGGVVAAILKMNADMRAEIQALRAELAKGNRTAAEHLDHDREWGNEERRNSRRQAGKVQRAA